MLAELEGRYLLDDKGNVIFERVVEVPSLSKDEIYTRALAYFIAKYSSGPSLIVSQDKEEGTIIGKGKYPGIVYMLDPDPVPFDVNYMVQIDTKEGRSRITVSLSNYEQAANYTGGYSHAPIKVSNSYPVNPKGRSKPRMLQAFYDSYLESMIIVNTLEKAIRGAQSGDW